MPTPFAKRSSIRTSARLALVPCLVLAAGAAGQEKHASPKDKPTDKQLLRGPKVATERVPGVHDSFGDDTGKGDRKSRTGPPLPHDRFMTILRTLETEAPADLRPTDAQRDAVRAIEGEFKAQLQQYRSEHQEEIRSLAKDAGPQVRERSRARNGAAPDGNDRPAPKDEMDKSKPGDGPPGSEPGPALRERMEELRRNAPKATDFETRMWHELTDAQQQFLTPRLETARGDMAKQFEEKAARRKVEQQLKKSGAGPKDQSPAGAPGLDRLPPRLRERLQNMSPEERQKALERLRNMPPEERRAFIQKRLREGRGGEGAGGEQPKPAPDMNDVKVPTPDHHNPK